MTDALQRLHPHRRREREQLGEGNTDVSNAPQPATLPPTAVSSAGPPALPAPDSSPPAAAPAALPVAAESTEMAPAAPPSPASGPPPLTEDLLRAMLAESTEASVDHMMTSIIPYLTAMARHQAQLSVAPPLHGDVHAQRRLETAVGFDDVLAAVQPLPDALSALTDRVASLERQLRFAQTEAAAAVRSVAPEIMARENAKAFLKAANAEIEALHKTVKILRESNAKNDAMLAIHKVQFVPVQGQNWGLQYTSYQEKKNKKTKTRNTAKGQPTVPVTLAKSGGARDEGSSPAARFATATELSVSFDDEAGSGPDAHDYEDYEDKTPDTEPGAATPETATLSSGLSGVTKSLSRNLADELDDVAGPEPAYKDYDDGTEGSKSSVASAKHSALLKAPRPPISDYTPAAKRVFDRVQALMQNDEWMQLFKPIAKRKADWPALVQGL
ncbi:hypothetical protein PInf_005139 [Phytophthora infestans]|nr:hypothetical protein PInf_005139 [Phytophthora infestans]